jgi:DNA-binding NtrC family response regulator
MKKENVILIVDDEDAIRLSMRDYLSRKGYKILVASEGVGAIKMLIDNDVDLIITDYKMDLFGGEYWVKFLNKFCPHLKVIVTSGYLSPDIALSYPILYKPFKYSEMHETVQKYLAEGLIG